MDKRDAGEILRVKSETRHFWVEEHGEMTDAEFEDYWDSMMLHRLVRLEEKLDKVSGQGGKNRRQGTGQYGQHMVNILLTLCGGLIGGCLLLLLEILLK